MIIILILISQGFTFHGNIGFDNEIISDSSGFHKPVFRFYFNPDFNIFGIPLSLNTLISTEQSKIRQNINKFSLYLKPEKFLKEKLKIPRFLFNIKGINFGRTYPQFSELTLFSVPVNGVFIDFSLIGLRFAFVNGNMRKPISSSDSVYGTYKRDIVGFRTGFGSDEGTHILFNFIHSYDIKNSIPEYFSPYGDSDSIVIIRPQENYVFGIDGVICLINNLKLKGEFALSQLTRDLNLTPLNIYNQPEWVFNIFKPNLSSSFDYAYSIKSEFSIKNTSLSFEYRFVGPGYSSFGNPDIVQDRYGFNFGINTEILSFFTLNLGYRNENNNIGLSNHTNFIRYEFQFGFVHPVFPYFNVFFSPEMEKNDSFNIDKRMNDFNITTGKNLRFLNLNNNINITYSSYNYNDTLNRILTKNLYFSYGLGFTFPLSLNILLGFSNYEYKDSTRYLNNYIFSLSYTKSFYTFSSGVNINKGFMDKTLFFIGQGFRFNLFGDLNIRSEYSLKEDNNEFFLRITYNKRW